MKIAILHDDFTVAGGGEILVSTLAKGLIEQGNDVTIFTYDISENTKKIIDTNLPITTIKIPSTKYSSPILIKYAFSKIHLNSYDVCIFSGHACLHANYVNVPSILYAHNIIEPSALKSSRPYQLTDSNLEHILSKAYTFKNKFIRKKIPKKLSYYVDAIRIVRANSLPLSLSKSLVRFFDEPSWKNIDQVITNSDHMAKKISTAHKRSPKVVYPPIDTKLFYNKPSENFWVSVNRIIPAKRIEMQLEAFAKLPKENLTIIGSIEDQNYYEKLLRNKPPNVTFLGPVKKEVLTSMLARSKGLIFTAFDEDFGMSPVEAMASGKPVIAADEGGCRETMIRGKTGVLIKDIDADKLASNIKSFSKDLASSKDDFVHQCQKRAEHFSVETFMSQFASILNRFKKQS